MLISYVSITSTPWRARSAGRMVYLTLQLHTGYYNTVQHSRSIHICAHHTCERLGAMYRSSSACSKEGWTTSQLSLLCIYTCILSIQEAGRAEPAPAAALTSFNGSYEHETPQLVINRGHAYYYRSTLRVHR